MTISQLYAIVARNKPKLIYLSGKSATGKSTFGRRLHKELGYGLVEIEAVLLGMVRQHHLQEQETFKKVFHDDGTFPEKDSFLAAIDAAIARAMRQHTHVVLEGAVANAATLERILSVVPDPLFVYFHPVDIDIYVRNLQSRFMQAAEDELAGLPKTFWQLVDPEEFQEFCRTRTLSAGLAETIRTYAAISQTESIDRLQLYRQKFGNIIVVDVE